MRRLLSGLAVLVGVGCMAPTALASVTPSVSLNPTSVTAGSTGNLEVQLTAGTEDANGETFAPSLTIRKLNLPTPKHRAKHQS